MSGVRIQKMGPQIGRLRELYQILRTTSLHRLRHDCTAHSRHHGCYMGCYGVRRAPTHPPNQHSHRPSRAHRRPSRAAAPRWSCDPPQPRCEGACDRPAHGRARRGERASMHAIESKGGGWLGVTRAGCGRHGMANLSYGDAAACTAARTRMAKLDIFLRPTKVCIPPSPQ